MVSIQYLLKRLVYWIHILYTSIYEICQVQFWVKKKYISFFFLAGVRESLAWEGGGWGWGGGGSSLKKMNRVIAGYGIRSRLCIHHENMPIYSRLSLSRTSRDLIKMFELSVVRDNQIVTS